MNECDHAPKLKLEKTVACDELTISFGDQKMVITELAAEDLHFLLNQHFNPTSPETE